MTKVAEQTTPTQAGERVVHETLARAVCAVMAELEPIHEGTDLPVTKNKSVSVAGIKDIAPVLQKLMAKHGLAMWPNMIERSEVSEHGLTQYNTMQFRVDLVVQFVLSHADSEETSIVSAFGQGVDTGDKAGYKAMTGAQKYALRLLFQLTTAHDPDNETPEPTQRTATRPKDTKQEQQPRQQSSATSTPQSNSRDSSGNFKTISKAQSSRVWAIAFGTAQKVLGRMLDDDDKQAVSALVSTVCNEVGGYRSVADIAPNHYEEICARIDSEIESAMGEDREPGSDG